MLLLIANLSPRSHFQAASCAVTSAPKQRSSSFKTYIPIPLLFVLLQISWTARVASSANALRLLNHNHTSFAKSNSIFISRHHQPVRQQQQQQHQQQQQTGSAANNNLQRRPDSSSSFFADIEDLNDSSIRTRTGTIKEALEGGNDELVDFDQLMERILQPIGGPSVFSPQQQKLVDGFNGHGSTVAADANNKTTMRFFRNNKTFASIVYTNNVAAEQLPASAAGEQVVAANRASINGASFSVRQPRKLINCHLVDLERHSSDVALFEAKYEIKTVDIEFNEMMHIIESCTNIARFKPLRTAASMNPSSVSTAAQLFAASLPTSPLNKGAFRPLLVVGRPLAAAAPRRPADKHLEHLQATFRSLDMELAGGGVADNVEQQQQQLWQRQQQLQLQPVPETERRFRRRLAQPIGPPQPEPGKKPGLLAQALARVADTHQRTTGRLEELGLSTKKLVLGEVIPPAQLVANKTGGIKEALQEITSYDTTDLMSIWRGILPGTNWCGMGDRATSYNDLGFESDIDICCRAHDFCPIRLSAFSAGYGLFNWSFYTRSHCRCDQNFLDCLERADSPLSAVVLRFYFTIMKTTCLHDSETNNAATKQSQQQQLQQSTATTSAALSHQTARHRQPPGSLSIALSAEPQQPANSQVNLAPAQLQLESATQISIQRRLLDQLRASLPIPALRLSQTLRTDLERQSEARSPQQQQQQQQASVSLQRRSNK